MDDNGWYQVAFTRDLTEQINPIHIGKTKLIAVELDGRWRVYDAYCPHRGTHLGFGGCLKGYKIRCPFHGIMVDLDIEDEYLSNITTTSPFKLKPYKSIDLGGLLFVQLGTGKDCGFSEQSSHLLNTCYIVPGFQLDIKVPHTMIIENAFDCAHFNPVHKIENHPAFKIMASETGAFKVSGEFIVPKSSWHVNSIDEASQSLLFSATAYSPSIVITNMQGSDPYWVITCATPSEKGMTQLYLSIVVPITEQKPKPDPALCKYLLQQSYEGLKPDMEIWAHMNYDHPPIYIERDNCIRGFQEFCKEFTHER